MRVDADELRLVTRNASMLSRNASRILDVGFQFLQGNVGGVSLRTHTYKTVVSFLGVLVSMGIHVVDGEAVGIVCHCHALCDIIVEASTRSQDH